MAEAKNKLTLVHTSPKAVAAPVLRASIIEATTTDMHPMPAALQKAIDRKAKLLANSAYELIRESIMREITCKCIIGRYSEIFLEDKALGIVSQATLDNVLVPIIHRKLEWFLNGADVMVHLAETARADLQKEAERFRGV